MTSHIMRLSKRYPTGAELWKCAICERTLIFYNARITPLVDGDMVTHKGGWVDLSIDSELTTDGRDWLSHVME